MTTRRTALAETFRGAARKARGGRGLRIGFVVFNGDGMGGTVRSAVTQANALAALDAGHRVTIVSVTRSAEQMHYRLDPAVEVDHLVDLRDPAAPRAIRPRVPGAEHAAELAQRESVLVPRRWDATFSALTDAALREYLGQVDLDVLVTTTPELLACVSQLAPETALVHQEHRASSSRVNDLAALLTFAPRADVVASLTGSESDWLTLQLRGAAPEMVVVPNPLAPTPRPRSSLDGRLFMAAGRLTPEKQFEQMVHAFSMVADELPGWRLRIWGDGPRQEALESQVRRLGLTDRVELPGRTDRIEAEWGEASVCLLSSRTEGLPLVLQEAMAAGVPVVSYDCPAGPRELVTDGVEGLLVPPGSPAALANAMLTVARDDSLRTRMGEAALAATRAYEAAALAERWVEIFSGAVARRRDPLAARRVLHGRTPGVLGEPRAGDSAVGLTPTEARRQALALVTGIARDVAGDGWWVVPAHTADEVPTLVVPAPRRTAFLDALGGAPTPPWLSMVEPALHGWPERRGTVEAMCRAVQGTGSAVLEVAPWPGRGGHDGLLARGCAVAVEFWTVDRSGGLVAPRLTRYGTALPAGTTVVDAEVLGVPVRTVPEMLLPTVDEVTFDVDVVCTWVDGDDPEWQADRSRRLGEAGQDATAKESSGSARYRDREELRWALRSLHLFAPWVRRIHLVTAGQVPSWLDTSDPRIHLVDHREILPAEALPTFSSHAIETRLHHVPGLAESFVYLNDDVVLGRPLGREFFFSPAGQFAAFVGPQPVGLAGSDDRPYLAAARTNQRALREAYGVNLTHTMLHSPHPVTRSALLEVEERYAAAVTRTTLSPFRAGTDVSMLSSLAQHHGLVTGRAFPGRAQHAYVDLGHHTVRTQLRALRRRDVDFFCLADNHRSAYGHDEVTDMLTEEMQRYLPVPAPWEK